MATGKSVVSGPMRIGVDTGGTFTDCVVFDGVEIKVLKVFSTSDDAARGIVEGVSRLLRRTPAAGRRGTLDVIHGTTLGTNSLLERRGARVALVTTAGFEDLIEIGRQNRPRLYDLDVRRESPLVARALRWGVRERTAADGSVLIRPGFRELRRLAQEIKRARVESIALCFLFSFTNPANERAAARALRGLGIPISVSHEILPEFREYERLSTVVINAFLVPRMGDYLNNLESKFKTTKDRNKDEASGRIFVMQSSGGISTAARAGREPVRTILSGPAGGVVAAAWLAGQLRVSRALSFDMGGTSTDVCLLDGAPRTTSETTLGGLPVAVPVLDVHSVGAGGGSLARIDTGGALRVGPESASARPGPICYGQGGTRPTVTDAHLVLGRLDAEHFLGGTFRLDARAAERGFQKFLRQQPRRPGAGTTGLRTPLELACGIVAVANANMEKALRVISVERGHDPRDFTLIAFGGAGGLHAADLARALGLKQVIVPRNPGAFSALGILLSDIVKDVSQSLLMTVSGNVEPTRRGVSTSQFRTFLRDLERRFALLERAGRAELRSEGFPAAAARAERRLGLRYVGQAYELSVPFTPHFPALFHSAHEQAYGYAHPRRPIEVVNLRLRLVIRTPKPDFRPHARTTRSDLSATLVKKKQVWFGAHSYPTPFFDRDSLRTGARVRGPAVIVEYSSTTVVPPDFDCRVDEFLNLVLTQHAR